MAAYNAPWQLGASQRNQDYRPQRKPVELVGTTQEWAGVVAAGARAKADQNIAAMQATSNIGGAGLRAMEGVIATGLRTQGDVAATGINARAAAYDAKTEADALVEREKAARGDSTLEYAKTIGGLAFAGWGLATL